jgi:hypothetical protein
MCPKDYQPSTEPKRTPGKAEGTEEDAESALRSKGMASTSDKNQEVGQRGKAPGGEEPNRTPGKAEG